MANEIDERVVSLEFQNSNFERNVKESLSTIDRLKKALDFTDAGKGLDHIDNTASHINFDSLSNGLIEVKSHFSTMEMLAINALMHIETQAINTGERLLKSLTIEQVTAGWDKYAEKTSAVQTIMAATSGDFDDTAEHMSYVNGQLEKLNWFTDETSYNFLDMVNNIGKFTSNQVPLDDSVTAMEGISTWAALSGANINEAGRAMYNLSQAISVGAVKLMDWKSIENANMATAEFKQTAIDTAVTMGTLIDVGDGWYETLAGKEVSVRNFNEALKDEWFTSEVLIETLNKYGGFTDVLNDFMNAVENENLTASKAVKIINDYVAGSLDMADAMEQTGLASDELQEWLSVLGDEEFALGRKAFAAAQEAKTFKEAIDSVKDAVSTGWMNTFELIFGNYEEAKVLWTDLANSLWDVFASGGEKRNAMLKDALTSNLDVFKDQIHAAGVSTSQFNEALEKTFSKYNKESFNDFIARFGSIDNAIKQGAISTRTLNEALRSLVGASSGLENITKNLGMGDRGEDVKAVQQALADLGYEFEKFGVDGIIGDETTGIIKLFQEANGLTVDGIIGPETLEALKQANSLTDEMIDSWSDLIANLDAKGGRELFIGGLANIGNTLIAIIEKVRDAWEKIFPPMTADRLYTILYYFNAFTESILDIVTNSQVLETVLTAVFSVFGLVGDAVMSVAAGAWNLVQGFLSLLSFVPALLAGFAGIVLQAVSFISSLNIIGTVIGTVTGAFQSFCNIIGGTIKEYVDFIRYNENLARIGTAIHGIFNKIATAFRFIKFNMTGGTGIGELFASLGRIFNDLVKLGIDKFFGKIADFFEKIAKVDFLEGAKKLVNWFDNLEHNLKRWGFRLTTRFKAFKWEYFKENMISLKNGLIDYFKNFKIPEFDTFEKKLESMVFKLKTRFKAFKWNAFEKEGANLTDGLSALFGNFKMPKLDAVFGFIGGIGTSIINYFKSIDYKAILTSITGIFTKASDYVKNLDFTQIRQNIIDKVKALKEPFAEAMKAIGDFFLVSFAGLGILFQGAFGKIKEWVKGGIDKVKIQLPIIKNYFVELWKKIKDKAVESLTAAGGIFDKLKEYFGTAFGSIGEGFKKGFEKIGEAFSLIKTGVGGAISSGVDILIGLVDNLMEFIGKLPVKSLIALSISLGFARTWWNIADAFGSASGMFKSIRGFFNELSNNLLPHDNVGDIVLKIANAFIRIAAALFIIAKFSSEEDMARLWDAVKMMGIMAGIMVGMAAAFAAMNKTKLLTSKDLQSVGIAILAMSIGIRMVIGSLKAIVELVSSSKENDLSEAVNILFDIAFVLTGMIAAFGFLSNKKMIADPKSMLSILEIAVAFEIMADVLKKINDIQLSDDINDKMEIFAGMLVGLIGIALLVTKVPGINMIGVLAVAFAMEIVLDVIKKINKFKFESVTAAITTIGKMLVLIGSLTLLAKGLTWASAGAGSGVKGVGIGVLAMAVALEVVIDAIKRVSSLEADEITKGIVVFGIIGLFFVAWVKAMSWVDFANGGGKTNSKDVGIGILAMSAAILVLSIAMHSIAKLSVGEMMKALFAIGIIGAVFTGLMAASKWAKGDFKTFAGLAIVIGTIAASLGVLALLPADDLLKSAGAIGGVMLALTAPLAAMAFNKNSVGQQIMQVVEIIAIMGSVVIAIQELDKVGADKTLKIAEGMAIAMAGLCGTLLALDFVGQGGVNSIKAVAAGVAGLDIVIADILGVFLLVGGAVKVFNDKWERRLKKALDKGIELVTKAGEAIGTIAGKIKGSYDIAVSESKITVAENLTKFAEELGGFIEVTSSEDFTNATAGVTAFSALIDALANAQLAGFLNGPGAALDGIEQVTWGDKLAEVGAALAGFASTIADANINFDDVDRAAACLDLLAVMNAKLPKTGSSFAKWFSGEQDLSKFGLGLSILGRGLGNFASRTSGVTEENITGATNAISLLAKMNDDLPKVDGIFEKFTGTTDYSGFSKGIQELGSAVQAYAASLSGIESGDLTVANKSLKFLVNLQNDMESIGGLSGLLFGDKESLSAFGSDLKDLGESLSTYSGFVSGIDPGKLNEITTSLSNLITAMDLNEDGSFGWEATDVQNGIGHLATSMLDELSKTLETLTSESGSIAEFGKSIASGIVEGLSDIGEIDMTSTVDGILISVDLAIAGRETDLKSRGMRIIKAFAEGMKAARGTVQQFARMLNLVAVNALLTVSAYSKGSYLGSQFASGIRSAQWEVVQAGEYLALGVVQGITNKTTDGIIAARTYTKNILDTIRNESGIHSPSKVTTSFGEFMGMGVEVGLRNQTESSMRAASSYASSVLSSISDVMSGSVAVTPSITPAFDLTAIQNGRTKIRGYVSDTAMQANIVANAMAVSNENKIEQLITNTSKICQVLMQGSDVYLNEDVLVGRVNRRLGALMS